MQSWTNSSFSAGVTCMPMLLRARSTWRMLQLSASRMGSLKVRGVPRRSWTGLPSGRRWQPTSRALGFGRPMRATLHDRYDDVTCRASLPTLAGLSSATF